MEIFPFMINSEQLESLVKLDKLKVLLLNKIVEYLYIKGEDPRLLGILNKRFVFFPNKIKNKKLACALNKYYDKDTDSINIESDLDSIILVSDIIFENI